MITTIIINIYPTITKAMNMFNFKSVADKTVMVAYSSVSGLIFFNVEKKFLR